MHKEYADFTKRCHKCNAIIKSSESFVVDGLEGFLCKECGKESNIL